MDNDNLHGFLRNAIPGLIFLLALLSLNFASNKMLFNPQLILGQTKAEITLSLLAVYPIGLILQWIYRALYLTGPEEEDFQRLQAIAYLGSKNAHLQKRCFCRDAALLAWAYAYGSLHGCEENGKLHEAYRAWVTVNFSLMHMLGASIFAICSSSIVALVFLFLNSCLFLMQLPSFILWFAVWVIAAVAAFEYRCDIKNTINLQLQAFISSNHSRIRDLAQPILALRYPEAP